MPGGQCAEPGGHPVDGLRVVREFLDAGAALDDLVQRLVGKRDRCAVTGDADHIVEAQGADAHNDGFGTHDRDSTFSGLFGGYAMCCPALTTSRTSGTPGR